ncbi:MAG: hypothetical protein KGD72_11330 [Candidatus Lokiarchaeota archaeon]|nr:hypothetical protein [Candidatus Lokiarchaeota archaeon]
MKKKGYWCSNCHGFVSVRKKYFWAIVGNILLLPLLILLDGPLISAKKICKRCEGSVKRKKMNVVDTILPEITTNPVAIENKIEQKSLPIYGIISLIFVLIGVIIVSIYFNSTTILFAIPILLISVIVAGAGIDADKARGAAIIGLIFGILFLLISLWPVFLFTTFIFVH